MKYRRIGQVAKIVGVETHVLRHWEEEGLIRPHRHHDDTRLYRQNHIERLHLIKYGLRTLGYTTEGMRRALRLRLITLPPDGTTEEPRRATTRTKGRKVSLRILPERLAPGIDPEARYYFGHYTIYDRPQGWTMEVESNIILGPYEDLEDLKKEIENDTADALRHHWGV